MRCGVWLLAKDPFSILGLTRSATKSEVKSRFRELARIHHPDAGTGDSEKMEAINKAYNLLLKEGAFERLSRKPAVERAFRPNPFSVGEESQKQGNSGVFSDEEAAKLSALDPATERVSPCGKFMYQNRDDGSWVELDRPLLRAHHPRYASHAARAEMSAELRRRSLDKEKEDNAKTAFQRVVDRMGDSAELPTRSSTLLSLYFLLAGATFYFMYQRTFARGTHQRNRRSFYQSLDEQRQDLFASYEEHRDLVETSVTAAALVFLAASQYKRETDPVVPPTPETHFRGVRPPQEHFQVISGG